MNALELADAIEKCSDYGYNLDAAKALRKQHEELTYWKEMFEKAMSVNEQIKYLESKVYGGTTK